MTRLFGLIGYPIKHSFSPAYFKAKFESEKIEDADYRLFELPSIAGLRELVDSHPNLAGLNVTIPHKRNILQSLDKISPEAKGIGAVNMIKITKSGDHKILTGYNTDAYGFEASIKPLLSSHHKGAMILGTGGAARAAAYVFAKLGIESIFVSRTPHDSMHLSYEVLNLDHFGKYSIIVNATPVGMWPNLDQFPEIPYQYICSEHLLFDMIYNPAETLFLQKGKKQGANVKNGLEMLHLQAEQTWKIWQEKI